VVVELLNDPTLLPRLQVTPAFVESLATLAVMLSVAPWLIVTAHEEVVVVPHAADPAGVSVMVMAGFPPEQPGRPATQTRTTKKSNPRALESNTVFPFKIAK
jgi:hypothetical protein